MVSTLVHLTLRCFLQNLRRLAFRLQYQRPFLTTCTTGLLAGSAGGRSGFTIDLA